MASRELLPLLPLLISLVVLSKWASPVQGEIKDSLFELDARPLILFEKFGFTLRGFVNISVSNVSWKVAKGLSQGGVPAPNPKLLGFFLTTEDALVQVLAEYEHGSHVCILHNNLVKLLFTFKHLNKRKNYSHSYPVSDANEYNLYFANCMPHVSVSMAVQTAMYNLEGPDGARDYLPAGQTQLPLIYLSFSLVYLTLLGSWIYVCMKNRDTSQLIHVLMGVVVALKAFNLLCESEDKAFTKSTGTPHGWDIAFYVLSFLKGVMLFIVIVLIGAGWSFIKPFLQDKDKRILMVVIPLQVLANVANVVIDEKGPFASDWFIWKQVFVAVDVLCCCAVLFPIMWSIRDLRKASQTDGKAARTLAKLTMFREYYIVLFVYIYFTRVVVYALTTVTVYKYAWVSDFVAELGTLAFYLYTGYKFRPASKNPYLSLDDEEEEAAAKEALKTGNFDL